MPPPSSSHRINIRSQLKMEGGINLSDEADWVGRLHFRPFLD